MNPTNNHAEPPGTCSSPSEVRAFLDQMKNRDTEEALGTMGSHTLTGAMVQATVITVVLLILCTFGPMVMSSSEPAPPPSAARTPEVKTETPEPAKTAATTTTPPTTNPPATTQPNAKAATTPPNAKDVMDKIGANDTKQASPKVNPLDKSVDDLFKDIDKK